MYGIAEHAKICSENPQEITLFERIMVTFFLMIWNIAVGFYPHPAAHIIGVLWPVSGMWWLAYRVHRHARQEQTDLFTQIVLLLKTRFIVFKFYFWPFDALSQFCGSKWSFRHEIESDAFNDQFSVMRWESRNSRIFASRHAAEQCLVKADRDIQNLRELPEVIEVKSRTAYACGATVMTLASATAAPAQTVSTNRLEVKTDGFVAVMNTRDLDRGTDVTTLSWAHLRASVKDNETHLLAFGEIELTQVGKHDANWLQMAYLGWQPTDRDEIRLGHLALAAPWMEPAPFNEEPVSFPEIPYNFYGWGLQYDASRGPWNFLADLSTDSRKRFDDAHQLDGFDSTFRIKRKMSPKLTLALAGEIQEDAQTLSVDASYKPQTQFYTRGTIYFGTRKGRDLVGCYVTSVLFPSKTLGERFDLHSLVDVHTPFGQGDDPYRVSVGARVQTRDKTWSATVDFTDRPKSDSKVIEMRLQRRF
jgi:hypothetical protein